MALFGKLPQRREFKLRKTEKPENNAREEPRPLHVKFDKPDRSKYPRLLNNWRLLAFIGVLALVSFFILRWLSGSH
jgi:hypothetical protein